MKFDIRSPKTVNWLFAFFLVFNIITQLVISVIFTFALGSERIQGSLLQVQIVSSIIAFGVPTVLYVVLSKKKLSEIFPSDMLDLPNVLFCTAISIFIQPAMMFLNVVSSAFANNDVSNFVTELSSTASPIMVFITIAVLPSILEELLFRGIILTGYSKVKLFAAALINGLFFGLMHLTLSQLLYAILVGAVLTVVVRYTKSIFASILIHFMINGSQVVLSYAFQNSTEVAEAAVETVSYLESVVYAGMLFTLSMPFIMALMYFFIKYNKKRLDAEADAAEEITPLVKPGETTDKFVKPIDPTFAIPVAIAAALIVLMTIATNMLLG